MTNDQIPGDVGCIATAAVLLVAIVLTLIALGTRL